MKALARTVTVIVSSPAISFVKPLKSWDKITPELPRAPRREPEDNALAMEPMEGSAMAATSLAAAMMVIVILVPVSPSGTGNTFNSLIHSFFASRFLAAERTAVWNREASADLIPMDYFLLNLSLSRLQRKY